jgi:diguanylate cyclase (GGDEF)-like protein
MAGKIRQIMETIIQERSMGNPAIAEMTKAKFILKGIRLEHYDDQSEDDEDVIAKLLQLKNQFSETVPENRPENIMSVYSTLSVEEEAVRDLKKQLRNFETKLLVFFASPAYDLTRVSFLLKVTFPESMTFGCSTAGEIATGKMLNQSIVAMAFNSKLISDAKIEIIQDLSAKTTVDQAFDSFERYYKISPGKLDPARFLGLVLVDGMCLQHEVLMDQIGNKTNIYFVGGAAGDDERYEQTYVCANGQAFTDAAILVLLKLHEEASFDIIKTQSFCKMDQVLVANKVHAATREVIEFNHQPAISAYAAALGLKSDDLAPDSFMTHPLGLVIDGEEIFVRSPLQKRGTHMKLFCNLLEGMEVHLLEATDIVADTQLALEKKLAEFGRFEGILNFNCILRTQQLQRMNQLNAYADLFKSYPTAGFSTYGEEYIGHINQTATLLVFKSDAEWMPQEPAPEKRVQNPSISSDLDDRSALLQKIDDLTHQLQEKDLQLQETTAALRQFNIVLQEEIHERSKREEEIRHLSYHDTLTGLFNRRYYEEAMRRLDLPQFLPVSIVIADVNGLKFLNDTYGHEMGDLLIRKTAESLQRVCRETDIIARWGGDEFAILLPHTDADNTLKIINRIQEHNQAVTIQGLPISVSFGVATRTHPDQDMAFIMKQAEDLMYDNKRKESHGRSNHPG